MKNLLKSRSNPPSREKRSALSFLNRLQRSLRGVAGGKRPVVPEAYTKGAISNLSSRGEIISAFAYQLYLDEGRPTNKEGQYRSEVETWLRYRNVDPGSLEAVILSKPAPPVRTLTRDPHQQADPSEEEEECLLDKIAANLVFRNPISALPASGGCFPTALGLWRTRHCGTGRSGSRVHFKTNVS